MNLPVDYYERVYAGVLGKMIGVYLGRPFEGWTYDQIMASFGEIKYYVNDRHDLPLRNHLLVVTDDDTSGTFIFYVPCLITTTHLISRPHRSVRPGSTTSSKTAPSCGGADSATPPSILLICDSRMVSKRRNRVRWR